MTSHFISLDDGHRQYDGVFALANRLNVRPKLDIKKTADAHQKLINIKFCPKLNTVIRELTLYKLGSKHIHGNPGTNKHGRPIQGVIEPKERIIMPWQFSRHRGKKAFNLENTVWAKKLNRSDPERMLIMVGWSSTQLSTAEFVKSWLIRSNKCGSPVTALANLTPLKNK